MRLAGFIVEELHKLVEHRSSIGANRVSTISLHQHGAMHEILHLIVAVIAPAR